MKLKEFEYYLPKNLIAQMPAKPRDHSRLLVLDKKTGKIEHRHFYEIFDYLQKGDLLVLNNTKVFPARLIGKKLPHGGRMEIFLLMPSKNSKITGSAAAAWQCLIGGRGAKIGQQVKFEKGLSAQIFQDNHDGTWNAAFNMDYRKMMGVVEQIGNTPLPPYIKPNRELSAASTCPLRSRESEAQDPTPTATHRIRGERDGQIINHKLNYQTVYADENKVGSVAAPTAGLHFTKNLLNELKRKGIQSEYITLHVGLGTFAPVKTEDITNHKMHKEWVEISKRAMGKIIQAKREGRRIIAVGTTSVRALESVVADPTIRNSNHQYAAYSGFVDIFIYPGYQFKIVDAMITNFHLPKSSLLMLVSAFAGKQNIDRAYYEAIGRKYRFYSFGDAMLIA